MTIMVLELKAPESPEITAMLALCPTVVSYALSYLFIAIIWTSTTFKFSRDIGLLLCVLMTLSNLSNVDITVNIGSNNLSRPFEQVTCQLC
ncbi:TMEM175 family protein, partial [Rhizobium ruizarguesonis]